MHTDTLAFAQLTYQGRELVFLEDLESYHIVDNTEASCPFELACYNKTEVPDCPSHTDLATLLFDDYKRMHP